MGKQLYFAHTEADILPLLARIDEVHGKFIVNGVFHSSMTIQKQIIASMSSGPVHYSLAYVPEKSLAKWDAYANETEGTAIQFVNCRKWSDSSRTYYDLGRMYLAPTKQGIYDPEIFALYKKLHSYFRKHYFFHKKSNLYISQEFKEQYLLRNIGLSQLGRPYPLRLFNTASDLDC